MKAERNYENKWFTLALVGGAGSDTASYANSGAGLTVNLGNTALNTGDAVGDSYAGIENLAGSGHYQGGGPAPGAGGRRQGQGVEHGVVDDMHRGRDHRHQPFGMPAPDHSVRAIDQRAVLEQRHRTGGRRR